MELRSIKDIYQQELSGLYPKEEIDNFFYLVLEHHLNLERFVLALQPDLNLTKEEEQPLFDCLVRLKKEEPVQYVLGDTFFYGMRLKVNPSVLIPRPETEELVNWIVEDLTNLSPPLEILDIGTGSGCIAIALARSLPEARLYAIDNSEEALKIARENAEMNQVNVQFREADIRKLDELGLRFNVIVSNPPYVRNSEKSRMKANVLKYEPHQALFVHDDDPLFYFKHITRLATINLKPGGAVYLEVNQYLSRETTRLLEDQKFSEIEPRKDFLGNDRMIKAVWAP